MSRLTVVIPATGSIAALEASLVSVLENRPEDCEVLVVLNQPYEDPYGLVGEVRFIHADPRANPVACINLGVQHARAAIVHVLASGHEVTEGWTAAAIRHFQRADVAAVAPLIGSADEQGAVAGVGYSSGGRRYLVAFKRDGSNKIVAPSLDAGFYRKEAIEAIGGFSQGVGASTADVDTALTLRRVGYKTVFEAASRVQSGEYSMTAAGRVRQAYDAQRLFWRNAPNIGWVRSLAVHPWTVTGELLASALRPSVLGQVAARAVASCQWIGYRRHHRVLCELARAAHIMPLSAGRRRLRVDNPHSAVSTGEPPRRAKAG